MKKLLVILLALAVVGVVSLPVMASTMTDAELEAVTASGGHEGTDISHNHSHQIELKVDKNSQQQAKGMVQNALQVNTSGDIKQDVQVRDVHIH